MSATGIDAVGGASHRTDGLADYSTACYTHRPEAESCLCHRQPKRDAAKPCAHMGHHCGRSACPHQFAHAPGLSSLSARGNNAPPHPPTPPADSTQESQLRRPFNTEHCLQIAKFQWVLRRLSISVYPVSAGYTIFLGYSGIHREVFWVAVGYMGDSVLPWTENGGECGENRGDGGKAGREVKNALNIRLGWAEFHIGVSNNTLQKKWQGDAFRRGSSQGVKMMTEMDEENGRTWGKQGNCGALLGKWGWGTLGHTGEIMGCTGMHGKTFWDTRDTKLFLGYTLTENLVMQVPHSETQRDMDLLL